MRAAYYNYVGIPPIIFVTALTIIILTILISQYVNRKYNLRFFFLSLIFVEFLSVVILSTLVFRPKTSIVVIRRDFLGGYSDFFDTGTIPYESILNIILFIPIGAILGLLFKRYVFFKVALFGLLFSFFIESMQLCLSRGIFDIGDLFNNTLGAVIGFCFVIIFRRHNTIRT